MRGDNGGGAEAGTAGDGTAQWRIADDNDELDRMIEDLQWLRPIGISSTITFYLVEKQSE